MWEFNFFANGVAQQMQWFNLDMAKLSAYEYSITLKGQDVYGVWDATGYYVNTAQGITAWWFKDYEQVNEANKSSCVYELIRSGLGNYTGIWYLIGSPDAQEPTNLKKRFTGSSNPSEIN